MSRTNGSTSDPYWVPMEYIILPRNNNTSTPVPDYRPTWNGSSSLYFQSLYGEDRITSEDNENPSGNDSSHESFPYVNAGGNVGALAQAIFEYLPQPPEDDSSDSCDGSCDSIDEPFWTGEYSSLNPVAPPNTPVLSWVDGEQAPSVPFYLDFDDTEIGHLFDYSDMETDEEDMSDSISFLFDNTDIAYLLGNTEVDDGEEPE